MALCCYGTSCSAVAQGMQFLAVHMNFTGTLTSAADWANELHPRNPGFRALADKLDAALQENI